MSYIGIYVYTVVRIIVGRVFGSGLDIVVGGEVEICDYVEDLL